MANTPDPVRFLKAAEVMSRTGLSRPSLYRLMSENRFPKNLKIAGVVGHASAWVESEVEDWMQARIAERTAHK